MTAATAAMMFPSMAAPPRAFSFRVAGLPGPTEVVVALSSAFHAVDQRMGQNNMKSANDTRHCRVQTRSNLPATLEDFNEAVAGAMREAVANDRTPAKRVAIVADRSHRAAEKWLAGVHAPHPFHLFKLAREFPALKSLLRKFLELERNLDPATERKLIELQKALAETLEAGR